MNKKGFTLMEVLIVVVIIAGLAAVTYPSYKSSIERARASEAVTMLGAIQAAQEKHFVNYEEYGQDFRDINDFEPAINGFDPSKTFFYTEYFKYSLATGENANPYAIAQRVNSSHASVNKGYELIAYYNEAFIRCRVLSGSEDGEKVCSSLTDKEKFDDFYPIGGEPSVAERI